MCKHESVCSIILDRCSWVALATYFHVRSRNIVSLKYQRKIWRVQGQSCEVTMSCWLTVLTLHIVDSLIHGDITGHTNWCFHVLIKCGEEVRMNQNNTVTATLDSTCLSGYPDTKIQMKVFFFHSLSDLLYLGTQKATVGHSSSFLSRSDYSPSMESKWKQHAQLKICHFC